MAKLARLPAFGRAAEADADVPRIPRLRTRYYAFLSYSHKDKELADWLHRELERFRVPHALAGKLTANGVVPRRLVPVFRDQQDLSAGGDLAEEIKAALAASQFLVVLCSPTAAKSRWTNQEIESFKRTRPEGCVLAAVASGEPFASDLPGREDEECFPPALRYKYDRRGHQTARRAEPLAADFRDSGEGKRLAFLKLVAGMLGVGLDELVQRETTRRHRQLAWLAAASIAGMAVTSTLAVAALEARDAARDQRRQAEGLVEFMLGDLKDKLEPIGKLDALDGVGPRVLQYYKNQNMRELSDEGLAQRSKALTLMGQIADARGNRNHALTLYQEAYAGTAEALRRNPDDPQRLFNHAQNVFYLADTARQRGDVHAAESGMQEYKRLAQRMVALDPNNLKWRMEERFAEMNLGILFFEQRRFPEAATQFADGLRTIDAIAAINPGDRVTQEYVPEAMAWLADAQMSEGRLNEAIAMRQRNVALLEQRLRQTGDAAYSQKLIPAHRGLGNLYAMTGRMNDAVQNLGSAVDQASFLVRYEPANATWLEFDYNARLNIAQILVLMHRVNEAAQQARTGCDEVNRLLAKSGSEPSWRAGLRDCLMIQAQVALVSASKAEALQDAQQSVAIAKAVHTSDAVRDRNLLAKAYRILGDTQRALGNDLAARDAWSLALATLPSGYAEKPAEMNEHLIILQRLGRASEARPLTARLAAIGFREPG